MLEDVCLPARCRALVTILNEAPADFSEEAIAGDWNPPEDESEEAWGRLTTDLNPKT